MSGLTEELALVGDFLSRDQARWREVGEDQSSPQVREMLQWSALYRSLVGELPEIVLTYPLMALICDRSGIGGGFLSCTEMPRGGAVCDDEDLRAAALLGQEGRLEEVLTACTFLSQGFDVWGGEGRPLLDNYRYLLPAVASYHAADAGTRFNDLILPPGWWDADETGPYPIRPDVLAYALNPRLDDERRRELLGHGPGLVSLELFGLTAELLGRDLSFLSPEELESVQLERSLLTDDLTLSEPEEDPMVYIEYTLEPMNLGYLVGSFSDGLWSGAQNVSESSQVSQLTQDNWIDEWSSRPVMDPRLWPVGSLRDAISESPW